VLPPAPQHAFFVRAAIAAGKDVYCAENFSHILAIYGGHFMDMLFHVVGAPLTLAAIVKDQFPSVTLHRNRRNLSEYNTGSGCRYRNLSEWSHFLDSD
jgi:predicted dehydrogenase